MRNEPARTAGGQPLPVVGTQVVTLPNVLSFLRLVGVPVFLWLILAGHDGWALAVLMASGISDYLDGKIARHYGLVSRDRPAARPARRPALHRLDAGRPGLRRHHPVVAGRRPARAARSSAASCCWWSAATATSVCRSTSSARPPRSTSSTPSPSCCSAQVSHTPRRAWPSRSGWAFVWWGTGLYWVAGVAVRRTGARPGPRGEGGGRRDERPRAGRPAHQRRPDESMTLITEMMQRPLDPGYAAAAADAGGRRPAARPPAHAASCSSSPRCSSVCSSPPRRLALRAPATERRPRPRPSSIDQIEGRRAHGDAQARRITALRAEINAAQATALRSQSEGGLANDLRELEAGHRRRRRSPGRACG